MLIRRTALVTVASVVIFGPTQVVYAQFDIEGIWTPVREGEEGRRAGQPPLEDVRLTPAGQAKFDNFGADNDPSFRCIAPGVPRGLVDPYPREIIEQEHQIVILHEYYHQVRRIFMDGREAPDYWPTSLGGYSSGQWDGDTLVVRTTHLSPDNDMWVSGLPFSGDENTYVIERYTRSDDVLSMVAEIFDPTFYEEIYVMNSRWSFSPDGEIWDYECNPEFGAVD
ncbi:MAG: hypothetical protein ACR2QQ_04340 [Gammaproteobacteria bacterium]